MTRTATYLADENCLQELPDLDLPPDKPIENNYWGNVAEFSRDMQIWKRVMDDYNANAQLVAAVCRRIPCSPECKGLWADQQKVVEGKDYEVRQVPCPYFDHIDDPVEYSDEAFPLVPVKSEDSDDIWFELLRHTGIDEEYIEGWTRELKQKYSLTKR